MGINLGMHSDLNSLNIFLDKNFRHYIHDTFVNYECQAMNNFDGLKNKLYDKLDKKCTWTF